MQISSQDLCQCVYHKKARGVFLEEQVRESKLHAKKTRDDSICRVSSITVKDKIIMSNSLCRAVFGWLRARGAVGACVDMGRGASQEGSDNKS